MTKFKNIKWLLCLIFVPAFMACGWTDIPLYGDANIDAVQSNYRWENYDDPDPITGEPMIYDWTLNTSYDINPDAGTANVVVTVPAAQSYFTDEVRNGVSLNNICITVTISTAARIAPADGHKVLGVPDDWTVPHNFVVTAADGTKKNWTITVTALNK